MAETSTEPQSASTSTPLPRVAIQFCTQCKWMLRAAYFAQELLSTFGTSIGEVALQPSTGGTFTVTLTHQPAGATTTSSTILWDRKTEGGFPETKELKRRLRDVIQPDRDLGHVDRKHSKPATTTTTTTTDQTSTTTTTAIKPETSTQQPTTLASDALATAPTMTMPSSAAASDVVSQLKKHPANAGHSPAASETKPTSESKEQSSSSSLSDAARDAIGAARANKGQQAKAEISPAGQLPGQQYDDPPAKFNKEKCEDCA
ncbi:putative selT/selW/selH selenoprotein domain-containing protein [Colletotrichum scovillei]|uniref:Selenoprotein w-like protein n=2 Tax=Colletotrichum acutatum species complex TaxID=2707335 RepID=A0A9P7UCX1_9PEZI|nr:putative selT/selW/selH selenoprotein domain-containing protein [Colletotrichum scovillei]KAF4783286.1 putative selT/selW/selH selenoprotein domain-containing protein [Colletotrichum scovillei]KAG7051424.1 selenoprotein w-like protein [Colletotrichum scovillei]KAG7070461.1 selenoprotein w-like protein [Colletotrichum scovillei]KAG7078676.1 selenoprotein w-like protein [Colletotrichum scovillei]